MWRVKRVLFLKCIKFMRHLVKELDMNFTFHHWLANQQERSDQIGQLARAMAQIQEANEPLPRRKPDEHKKWAGIVIKHGEPEDIFTFNQAWQEYKKANPQQ